MTRRASLLIGAVVGALVTMLAGGIAWAAIPAVPGGVIQGCYDSGGNVKVVEALPCPPKHTPFQWNQQGAPGTNGTNGTNGTDGIDGADGAPGMNGTNGVSGYEIVLGGSNSLSYNSFFNQSVLCPAGKVPVGGGAWGDIAVIRWSTPTYDLGVPTGWRVTGFTSSTGADVLQAQVFVQVICISSA
jgi:Collagen triple helix repeat (20 copies)